MDQKTAEQGEKKKILEPTFHYHRNYSKLGKITQPIKSWFQSLFSAGQLLADFPNFHRFAAKGFQKAALEPGANVRISEDEQFNFRLCAWISKNKENSSAGLS